MSKIKIFMIVFTVLLISFVFVTNVTAEETDSTISVVYKIDAITEQSRQSRGVLSALWIVVKWVASNVLWDVLIYCAATTTDMTAVHQWATENGYNMADMEITIGRRVYDNGCYQPEFLNNPFCRMQLSS